MEAVHPAAPAAGMPPPRPRSGLDVSVAAPTALACPSEPLVARRVEQGAAFTNLDGSRNK